MIFIDIYIRGFSAYHAIVCLATYSFSYYVRVNIVFHLMIFRATYGAINTHIGLNVSDHL